MISHKVGPTPAPNSGHAHQLYAAWAAAAAAAALASHQHSHQAPHFWPPSPLSHAALLQQHQQHRDDLENNRDRGKSYKFKSL